MGNIKSPGRRIVIVGGGMSGGGGKKQTAKLKREIEPVLFYSSDQVSDGWISAWTLAGTVYQHSNSDDDGN